MGIGTTIALLTVSFFGLIFWATIAAASANAKNAREAAGIKQRRVANVLSFLTLLVAAGIVVAPLIVIIWKAAIS